MDFDLHDLISSDAANNAKATTKFQPKAKAKAKARPKPNPKPKPKTQPEPISAPTPSTQFVDAAATTDYEVNIDGTEVEHPGNDIYQIPGNINDNWQSSFEKLQDENAESFLTLDSLNDFLPEPTTETVNSPPCSETLTVNVSMDGNLETGSPEPDIINNIDASTNLETIAEVDPLTGEEAVIFNDNEYFQIGNLSLGSKDAEIPFLSESLDILSQSKTGSGPQVGKFKPKPKAQTRKVEQIVNTPDQDVGTAQYGGNIHSVPSQTDYMENDPVPSFTPDEILGSSSIRDTISDFHANEEPINSVNEADRSSERLRKRSNKTLQLIDESEDDGIDDDFVHDNVDSNNNDDYVPENEFFSEKKGSKSKKPVNENKKPVRKRKKASEVPDELANVAKKKFTHRTRKNKRQVNPELLNIPEDELELHMHNIPMKELIRLAEHRERIAKKEASTSGTSAINQSEKHEAFAQGTGPPVEHKYSTEAQNSTYYNYGTHMKIKPRMKWSKQDTELFYEAVQQFGTDLSMIKECFPGRTREQIKSKYKKEERQQPLRLNDALTTRAKGHSHFEVVIARLKEAQAEESENDGPINLTGEEDDEVAAADINEAADAATKLVQLEKEVKDMEPDDVPAVGSPTKSNDSEDDMYRWSQYKSEI